MRFPHVRFASVLSMIVTNVSVIDADCSQEIQTKPDEIKYVKTKLLNYMPYQIICVLHVNFTIVFVLRFSPGSVEM